MAAQGFQIQSALVLSLLVWSASASISYNDLFIIDCTVNLRRTLPEEVITKFQCQDILLFTNNPPSLSFSWTSCPLDSTSPVDACSSVNPSPSNTSRVAVVPTNICQGVEDCEKKTKADSLSGGSYVAFITWDDYTCSKKGPSGGGGTTDNSTDPSIVAIVLTKGDGAKLNSYTNRTEYVVDVSVSLWRFGDLLLTFLGVFLGTTACMCACFCCVFAVRVYMNRPRTTTLTNRELNRATKKIKYRKSQGVEDTCSICLEEFNDGDVIRQLPCRHLYHNQCVDTWLQKYNALCPNCKTPIKSASAKQRTRSSLPLLPSSLEEEEPLLGSARGTSYGSTPGPEPPLERGGGGGEEGRGSDSVPLGRRGSQEALLGNLSPPTLTSTTSASLV